MPIDIAFSASPSVYCLTRSRCRFFQIHRMLTGATLRFHAQIRRTVHNIRLCDTQLLARLGELDDYGFFEAGNETQSSLWEGELPTVVRVHTTQNDNLQRAFAYLVFYGLYKDMFRRGVQDRISHSLIFDEAHRAAGLKLIPTMAKECRKYGISLVLASREARDFDISIFSLWPTISFSD